MSDDILDMDARLAAAKEALEYYAMVSAHSGNKINVAQEALAKIWPAPPRPIEVGRDYVCKSGVKFRCIAVDGERAYLTSGGLSAAYIWTREGKSAFADRGYDIDWSRS